MINCDMTNMPIDSSSENHKLIEINQNATKREEDVIRNESKEGLFNMRAILFLVLWYFFSFCTLFLNKYILTYLRGDPTILGACQMLMTAACGFIQMFVPCGLYKKIHRKGRPPNFLRNMVLVGSMRFSTVILGLVALKYVAVSFTETVKSSAPIFTVIIARMLLGERTGCFVNLSLLPVMSGLALCSANELSFNVKGFIAAMATNLTECLQNVYSKMLISGERYKYTPAELQFYTSIASVVVQIPAAYVFIDFDRVRKTTDETLIICFLVNGFFFHCQSITAYALMGYISPVTHRPANIGAKYQLFGDKVPLCFLKGQTIRINETWSVANTAKRALLIWLSVVMFGNPVTFLSGLGTGIVIFGVLCYNKAREYDADRKLRQKELLEEAAGHRPTKAIHEV
ncbi:Solute carrier family 35 member E2B [Nymphon striatum]|nr:Solute carrier family 35 member E2B [Nymphon striatum]